MHLSTSMMLSCRGGSSSNMVMVINRLLFLSKSNLSSISRRNLTSLPTLRLSSSSLSISQKYQYQQHSNPYNNTITTRLKSTSTSADGFEDLDKPIQFTTSKAAIWKASDTLGGGTQSDSIPDAQPYIVTISVGIFLLYFLALREENDIDEEMKIPLWDRIPGLERQQLEMLLEYNSAHGLPTDDIKERLEEVRGKQAQLKQGQGKK